MKWNYSKYRLNISHIYERIDIETQISSFRVVCFADLLKNRTQIEIIYNTMTN